MNLHIDDLTFALHRSPKRKTVGITIERDNSLTLRAPVDCSLEAIRAVVQRRALWIHTKLAEKGEVRRETDRQFVEGERFYYLGKRYQLVLDAADADNNEPPLRLYRGRFRLSHSAQQRAESHFATWYTQQGKRWIQNRVEQLAREIGIPTPHIQVRELGFRWGSCSPNGYLNFHWRVICLPPRAIDYVLIHELVHLEKAHHNAAFWGRLGELLPDFAERKDWLAKRGAYFCGISRGDLSV